MAIRHSTVLVALVAVGLLLGRPVGAQSVDTPATHALMIDAATGAVLFEKNADVPMPPASMSKLMTLLMVFERLEDGSIGLEDTMRVSEAAWRMGGSRMFVEHNSRVPVEDLLRGVII